jgi:DNA-binding beta-propeller fold protein YncE
VIAFSRDPKTGSLTVVDTQSTGGAGNPIAMPGDPPTDALASQGALAVDDGNNYLYAVNAGSNEISVLAIKKSGLELVQKIPSGGTRPISLAIYGDWVYVLNEGGTPNITGFSVADNGTLSAIDGSVQPLIGGTAADPAEVGFNQDGTLLVVTEKAVTRTDAVWIRVRWREQPFCFRGEWRCSGWRRRILLSYRRINSRSPKWLYQEWADRAMLAGNDKCGNVFVHLEYW